MKFLPTSACPDTRTPLPASFTQPGLRQPRAVSLPLFIHSVLSDTISIFAAIATAGLAGSFAALLVFQNTGEANHGADADACHKCDGTGYVACFCTRWQNMPSSQSSKPAVPLHSHLMRVGKRSFWGWGTNAGAAHGAQPGCAQCGGNGRVDCPGCGGKGMRIRVLKPATRKAVVHHLRNHHF